MRAILLISLATLTLVSAACAQRRGRVIAVRPEIGDEALAPRFAFLVAVSRHRRRVGEAADLCAVPAAVAEAAPERVAGHDRDGEVAMPKGAEQLVSGG